MSRPTPYAFAIATLTTLGVACLGGLYNFLPQTRIFLRENGSWRAVGTVHGVRSNRLDAVGREIWASGSAVPASTPPVLLPPALEIDCPGLCRMVQARGNIWALGEKGLHRYDGWRWRRVRVMEGGLLARTHSLATDGQILWVSDDKGLFWKYQAGNWKEDSAPEISPRLSLAWTPAGLWAAGAKLWLRPTRGSWTPVPVKGTPRIVESSSGFVWVQAADRLLAYRSMAEPPIHEFPQKAMVRQVAQVGLETWVLAEGGAVTVWGPSGATQTELPRESGEVQGLAADAAGRLWLAGWVGGAWWSPFVSGFLADLLPAIVLIGVVAFACRVHADSGWILLAYWGSSACGASIGDSLPWWLLIQCLILAVGTLGHVAFKLWRVAPDKSLLVPAWCLAVVAALWAEFVFTHGSLVSLKRWLDIGGYGELVALAINCAVVTMMVTAGLALKRRVAA